jgi:hypothetical protein
MVFDGYPEICRKDGVEPENQRKSFGAFFFLLDKIDLTAAKIMRHQNCSSLRSLCDKDRGE